MASPALIAGCAVATVRGCLDMAAPSQGCVHEFEVVDRGQEGWNLAQIRERGYADKYRHLGAG